MPAAINPDRDWAVFDNTETVTYYPFNVALDAVSASGTPVLALKFMETKREEPAPEGGQVIVRYRNWALRKSVLDTAGVTVTKRGEIEEAGGIRWVVGDVEIKTWGSRYWCRDCVRRN